MAAMLVVLVKVRMAQKEGTPPLPMTIHPRLLSLEEVAEAAMVTGTTPHLVAGAVEVQGVQPTLALVVLAVVVSFLI
jgi:hypothetical protein